MLVACASLANDAGGSLITQKRMGAQISSKLGKVKAVSKRCGSSPPVRKRSGCSPQFHHCYKLAYQ